MHASVLFATKTNERTFCYEIVVYAAFIKSVTDNRLFDKQQHIKNIVINRLLISFLVLYILYSHLAA